MKKKIIDWFNGPQDYNEGLKLLQVVSKKNKVIGKLMARGDTRTNREKLIWELNRIAGLKTIPAPGKAVKKPEKDPVKAIVPKKANGNKEHLIGSADINQYPVLVRRLVHEYSEQYKVRSIAHKNLSKLPDNNESATIELRKPLIQEIKAASARMEVLYEAWKRFEKDGTLPVEENLWPEKPEIPADRSADSLKREKKNLIASLTKDRNALLYGSKVKPVSGNGRPLPDGPKKIVVEKRIAAKEAQIQAIDYRLAEME